MAKRTEGDTVHHGTAMLSRRKLLLAGAGVAARGVAPRSAAQAQASERPDPKAAAAEGPIVVWHGDQEADVVKFLQTFTEKTGVKTVQQRLLPGAAVPKLEAEFRTGTIDVDAWMTSDAGIMENLRKQDRLTRYIPQENDAFGKEFRSEEPGW